MQYDSYSYGSFYCTMQLKVFVYITCKKSVFFVHLLLPLSRVERQTDRERILEFGFGCLALFMCLFLIALNKC